mmetsp:Transcript_38848/g.102412  ORF Transcript_38848/g.102412 Transcript_38848/m.102412 type:complete len:127 (-) Transcript_38848:307-687(-)
MLSSVRAVAARSRPAAAARLPLVSRRMMGAVSTGNVDMNLGRTPERTAEIERLAAEHNGFLFGELPPAEGESRQWEDWEYSYVPLMSSAFLLYGLAYYFRPQKNIAEWAREEALSRAAADGGEEEE